MIGFRHALITVDWEPELVERLVDGLCAERHTVCSHSDRRTIRAALDTADVAVLGGTAGTHAATSSTLRWLHIDAAGIDSSATAALFTGRTVTCSSGRNAPAIADQAVWLLLSLVHRSRVVEQLHRRRAWSARALRDMASLNGGRAVIIGAGATAIELAPRLRAMGLHPTAIARHERSTSEPFDRIVASADRRTLLDELSNADAVVLAASLNDATHHLIDDEAIERLPRHARLVNVGRGALVDQRALARALHDGSIAGAGLAVADPEPLPPWPPLWRSPNTLVVPHAAPRVADRDERALDSILRTAEALRGGTPPAGSLSPDDVYTLGADPQRLAVLASRAWIRTSGRTVRAGQPVR